MLPASYSSRIPCFDFLFSLVFSLFFGSLQQLITKASHVLLRSSRNDFQLITTVIVQPSRNSSQRIHDMAPPMTRFLPNVKIFRFVLLLIVVILCATVGVKLMGNYLRKNFHSYNYCCCKLLMTCISLFIPIQ